MSSQQLPDIASALSQEIADLFVTLDITTDYPQKEHIRFRGAFLCDLAREYDTLRQRFAPFGFTPLIRQYPQGNTILLALPQVFSKPPLSWKLNLLLFLLTILSTLLVGSQDAVASEGWVALWRGWPFSLSMLLILGAHELGHFFAARRHGIAVTLPFFIPMPLSIIGTMGAFISIQEPVKNRRALLDIGMAGPLAGLIFAIPILLIGLWQSEVSISAGAGIYEGNSILYLLAKWVTKGAFFWERGPGLPDVLLNQTAWAGWCGLLVTGLNLLPVGQLDGGHAAYVLWGQRARLFFWPVVLGMGAVALLYDYSWWMWILLLFFFGRSHPEPLDDVTPLNPARRTIAIFGLILFILIFVPVPLRLYSLEAPPQYEAFFALWGLIFGR